MKKTPKPIKVLKKNIDPKVIAKQYLYHEFIKLFGEPKDKKFIRQIHDWVYNFDKLNGDLAFWSLLSGIAENLKLKWTYRILTDSSYRWNLEIWPLSDITMTGMGPELDKIIRKCDFNYDKFAKYWKQHVRGSAFEKKLAEHGLHPKKIFDDLPILLRQDKNQFKVFDGMRRSVLAAIAGKKQLKAYVGHQIRRGRPQVNRWQLYFLTILLDEASSSHDEKLMRAIGETLRGIFKRYKDSKKSYRERIYKWVKPDLKKLIEKYVFK